MSQHQLAIISVVYQNYDVLGDFIKSLQAQTDQQYQLFINDHTPNPKTLSLPPFVHLSHSQNNGYAYGVNEGITKAAERGFTRFCVINNDTLLEENFVERATSAIDSHPRTIIGGKIYYAKGFEYHKNKYDKKDLGNVLWYAGGGIDWAHAYTVHYGVDEVDRGEYDTAEDVDFITGCMMCFDKEVVDKVGGVG